MNELRIIADKIKEATVIFREVADYVNDNIREKDDELALQLMKGLESVSHSILKLTLTIVTYGRKSKPKNNTGNPN